MKLPVPSRKVRLTLSILFLLFSLVFLWWAVGSPMPTPGLAHRAALLSYGLTPGPVEAQAGQPSGRRLGGDSSSQSRPLLVPV